jgi:GT2 family glycosyltransferase
MSAATLKFSVVVPACARPEQLARCLERLAPGAQTYPAENYEVIVTDDSKDDVVREMVKSCFNWAQWTAGPRRGPASNRNHGASLARGEWLAFTDDDCLPEPGWLAAYALTLSGPDDTALDALEGRTYTDRPRQSVAERSPINTHGGYWWSCNFAIRTAIFRRLGGFNEGFPYAAIEDVDFALRMKEAGLRQKFVAAAGVCHPWREIQGFRAMWTVERKNLASVRYYLQLHPEEHAKHSPGMYFRYNARQLVKETLPGLWRCHGRGAWAALAWHLHGLLNVFAMMKPARRNQP